MAIKLNSASPEFDEQTEGNVHEASHQFAPFDDPDDGTPDAIELIRERLDIDEDEISDVTIAASLAAVAAKGDPRARWLAAFSSPLGKWLAMRGTDLNTALNVMMSLAPSSC